jgi:uncharacterized protein (TIRG00374 family)
VAVVKRWLMTLVKLLLVAGLMAWVLGSVDWHDRLVYTTPAQPAKVENGVTVAAAVPAKVEAEEIDIQGPWNADDVVVGRPAGSTLPTKVRRGAQPDGRELEVKPGLITYWRNLDRSLFALGAFCYLLTLLMAGARWWWLLRVNGMNVKLREALAFTWIGTFFNTVVPGATGGDLIKAIYIMKRCPGQRVPALVSVIVDRVLGLTSLAILAAVLVLFALDRFAPLAIGIWSVMAGVALVFMFAFSKRLRSLIRLNVLLQKLPPKLSRALRMVDDAVFFYRDHKTVIVGSLLAGIGNHIVSVASVMFIGQALGVGMPPTEYFVLIPVINIVSALPLAPNGWGVGEGLYRWLFGTYGAAYVTGVAANSAQAVQVMGTRGVALSVLYRLHLTVWSLIGGLFVLTSRDRVTKADIQHEVDLEHGEEVRQSKL